MSGEGKARRQRTNAKAGMLLLSTLTNTESFKLCTYTPHLAFFGWPQGVGSRCGAAGRGLCGFSAAEQAPAWSCVSPGKFLDDVIFFPNRMAQMAIP